MPVKVEINGRVVEFASMPTPEDIDAAAASFGAAQPSPAPAPEPSGLAALAGGPQGEAAVDWAATTERAKKAIPMGIRAAGGAVASAVGSVPSPATTPAAAVFGATTEAVAQAAERLSGTRPRFNLGAIATEGALSAIPLGKTAGLLKEGAKIAGVEALGAQARSLVETGEPASLQDTLLAAGLGAGAGAVSSAMVRNADEVVEALPAPRPAATEAAQPTRPFALLPSRPYLAKDGSTLLEHVILKDGEPIGSVFIEPKAKGEHLHIDWVGRTDSKEPLDIGAGNIRSLLKELRNQYPDAKTVGGERLSGIRTGRPEKIKVRIRKEDIFDDAGYVRPEVPETGLTVEGATAKSTEEMVDAVRAEGKEAIEMLGRTEASQAGQRLYHQVGELYSNGEIDAPGLINDLRDSGLSMPEWIENYYKPSVKRSARQLQQLSTLAKELKKQGLLDDETFAALANSGRTNRFWDFLQKLDDTRRALLITQVKTGARNFITQGGAAVGDLLEVGMTGGSQGIRDQLGAFATALHHKKAAAQVDQLLKGRSDLRQAMGEFEYQAPGFIDDYTVLKSTIGRLTELTTAVNRWQEMFFRNAKFTAGLKQRLRAAGIDPEAAFADPKLIPDQMLDDSVEDALALTFASQNPGGLGKIVTGMQLARPITTFLTPFPRYMANAMTYIAKHNPLGLARLATTAGKKNAKKVWAESTIGTMYLAAALALRYSEGAGEKWYEVKKGDTRYDLRGFAGPFAPFLFAAEAIRQVDQNGSLNYTGKDIAEGLLSMNRVSGTAATMLSWMERRADEMEFNKEVGKLAGDWLSGFLVPGRNLKDAITILGDEEEGKLRDAREEGILGAFKANLPGASKTLPERYELTTGEPIKQEAPVLSGVFGLNARSVDAVEAEINRLNIPFPDLAPKTGIPKVDRELYRRVGKIIAAYGPKIVATQAYQKRSDAEKEVVLRDLFKSARKIASDSLKAEDASVAKEIKAKRVPKYKQRAMAQR